MLMPRSRPLLLLVVTLSLLLLTLVTFWLALLPQRMVQNFKQSLLQEKQLVLESQSAQLGYDKGFVLSLSAVSLASTQGETALLSAQELDVDLGLAALFGAGLSPQSIKLRQPVITLDVSSSALPLVWPDATVTIEDGILKLRDPSLKAVVALSDVNGRLSKAADGSGNLDLRFIQNSVLSNLVVDVDNVARLGEEGSPLDATLSAHGMAIAFSGRGRLQGGLGLDGKVLVDAADSGTYLAWLGVPIKSLGDSEKLKADAGVSTQGLSAAFTGLTLSSGAVESKGIARVLAGPDRLSVVADLTVNQVALLNGPAAASVFAQPWRETSWAWPDLYAVAADLKIATPALTLRGAAFGAADLSLTSDGQRAVFALNSKPPSGGEVHMGLVGATGKDGRTLETDIDAKAANAKILLTGLFGLSTIDGTLDLKFKTTGFGDHTAAQVSTLAGTLSVALKNGTLAGTAINELLKAPHDGWLFDATTTTKNLSLSLEAKIQDGILKLQRGEARGDEVVLKPQGEVDLLRQAFDLSLSPKGKSALADMKLRGTWAKPDFTTGQLKAAATPPAN